MKKQAALTVAGFLPLAAWKTREMHGVIRKAFGLLLGGALLMASLTAGTASAFAQFAGPAPLALVNGWTDAPFGTSHATVEEVAGIVQFRGAIAGGTSVVAFTLPASLTPAASVYVPVDMCGATNGRLIIQSNGNVSVQAESAFANAQCFTALDGASFALSTTGFTALTLINGWSNTVFGTNNPAVQKINGIVHFQGAMSTTGANAEAFVLPKGYRPTTNVYIPVDLCNATNGRLNIAPTGIVMVEAETVFSNAQCFTSLEGAWFAASASGFKALTLINGWTESPFATSKAEAANEYGIVYFKGAIATGGTSPQPFTLPVAFRPVTTVYVPVDLCDATKGRLYIQLSGSVFVEAETVFANAECFTSLDGVSFVQ